MKPSELDAQTRGVSFKGSGKVWHIAKAYPEEASVLCGVLVPSVVLNPDFERDARVCPRCLTVYRGGALAPRAPRAARVRPPLDVARYADAVRLLVPEPGSLRALGKAALVADLFRRPLEEVLSDVAAAAARRRPR